MRFGEWGISFYLSLQKHPFTGFAGASPRAGKRRVSNAATCRFPIHGEAVPKGLKGSFSSRPILVDPLFYQSASRKKPSKKMSSPPERRGERGPCGTLRQEVPDWLTPSGMTTPLAMRSAR